MTPLNVRLSLRKNVLPVVFQLKYHLKNNVKLKYFCERINLNHFANIDN